VVSLELDSLPYLPAASGDGADARSLGVVVSWVAFDPIRLRRWMAPLENNSS